MTTATMRLPRYMLTPAELACTTAHHPSPRLTTAHRCPPLHRTASHSLGAVRAGYDLWEKRAGGLHNHDAMRAIPAAQFWAPPAA